MKKIIVIAILLIASFTCFGDSWERLDDLEKYLMLFEIDVAAWFNPGTHVLNFEDDFSEDVESTLFQFGYLMEAFEFMLIDLNMEFEDMDIGTIIYSYIANEDYEYDIYMDYDWLVGYFSANPRQKQNMLLNLVDEQFGEILEQQQKGML